MRGSVSVSGVKAVRRAQPPTGLRRAISQKTSCHTSVAGAPDANSPRQQGFLARGRI